MSESPLGLNIAPADDPSITSGLTHDADENDYYSLLDRVFLDIDTESDDVSLLGYNVSLTCESLGASTAIGHNSSSKVKHATSILTQEFNATFNKEI